MHLSPNEIIPEYLLAFTSKQNENIIQEINDKKRSELFEIFEIISIAVKKLRQKSRKSRCT